MVGGSEKGTHYISLLDAARVAASWSELPELIRKVQKHAPQRKTLIQTAAAEHEVAVGSGSANQRSITSAGAQSTLLNTLSNTLQTGGDAEAEDTFQGKTCLLWSKWVSSDNRSVAGGIDTIAASKTLEGKSITTWTKICVVKSAYIEGTSYVQNGRPGEAQRVFSVAVSNMQSNQELVLATPQLAYWSEQLLAQLALSYGKRAQNGPTDNAQIEIFRYWAVIASKTREANATTYRNANSHLPRLSVWRRYYGDLIIALRKQMTFPNSVSNANRLQQSTEIRKVERAYESELLRAVKFPTATESNELIGKWVEQAISVWQILCGPVWRESELGEGGRDAIARNTLDVLYRAATKTFHSTLILRRLFQVHLYLSEFDLAYRAFDTYIELVDRGRERVAKSGVPEPGQESDEAVLSTISQAIVGLCKFGGKEESRKAYHLSLKVENWLLSMTSPQQSAVLDPGTQNGNLNGGFPAKDLDTALLQTLHRTVGIGKAHWARLTPESETRSELQEAALSSLKKSCSFGEPDIDTLFVFSLLLAEMRDVSGAIQAAKKALAKYTSSKTNSSGWVVERKLVALWHLLALLLSSRQDFESAGKSCLAAFEQFAFQEFHVETGRNSSVVSNIEQQFNSTVSGFVNEMPCDELQKIIEVRITELALTELVDGPEEAVNSSNELLSLFSRLFAHLQIPMETSLASRTTAPPKSSAGTMKSARNSMFGRKRHEDETANSKVVGDDTVSMTTDTTRPSTRATLAPVIQVTTEDEKPAKKKHSIRKSFESSHSKLTTDGKSRKLNIRHGHQRQESTLATKTNHDQRSEPTRPLPLQPPGEIANSSELAPDTIPPEHEKSSEAKQELPHVAHNLGHHNTVPPPASHNEQPPQQDVRLPTVHSFTNATSPAPRFPKSASQKQALVVLTKVWLIIATLYRRANMFEDSKEACEEASKAATKIETLAGVVDQSARTYGEADWGAGTRSSDDVWADVYCERAELQLAIYKHKAKEGNLVNHEELRTAVDHYEQCLMFAPNHPGGIIGLSNVLLDSYERKVDLGRQFHHSESQITGRDTVPNIVVTADGITSSTNGTASARPPHLATPEAARATKAEEDLKKTPENLNRIAARDRAYGLLSTLTKLGSGWDNSEAWFALARAHELGGEIEKAKDVLWWCVELEDTRPIRHWRNVGYFL